MKKNKFLKTYGRKFSFAVFVLVFVIFSIMLNVTLLCTGKIDQDVYMKLYMFSGGFITLLATSYFYSNAKSKEFGNKNKE